MRDVINEARKFHEEHKMKIGRDYRLEFLKLSKEDIYDFLETKYGDYIHGWRQKLWESENIEKELREELKSKKYTLEDMYSLLAFTERETRHNERGAKEFITGEIALNYRIVEEWEKEKLIIK